MVDNYFLCIASHGVLLRTKVVLSQEHTNVNDKKKAEKLMIPNTQFGSRL